MTATLEIGDIYKLALSFFRRDSCRAHLTKCAARLIKCAHLTNLHTCVAFRPAKV